jgi:ADP-ribose pyrophosphatase YjhB (NUDIX family)
MTASTGSDGIESLTDPETLRERAGVPDTEVRQRLDDRAFEGMGTHYGSIDGVVQVGVTTDDGRLLLQGSAESGEWAPPGGSVPPGEDWVAAARLTMETQTGVDITIDTVELYEHLVFEHADDPERRFSAPGVSFAASVVDAPPAFLDDPDIVEHPRLPEDHDQTFAWFETVPADANENHREHIEMFLD